MASKESKKRHTTAPRATKKPAAKKPAAGKTVAKSETTAPVEPVQVVETSPVVAEQPTIDLAALQQHVNGLRHYDADTAREAAGALGAFKHADAVDALVDVLWNNDGYYHSVVRAAAASSLGQIGDTRAVDALLNAVQDPMAEASAEAVRALAELGDERAVQSLINVVRNVDGFYLSVVRLAAVHALVKFNTPEAQNQLTHVANDTYEDTVIRDAASNR